MNVEEIHDNVRKTSFLPEQIYEECYSVSNTDDELRVSGRLNSPSLM